MTKHPIDNTIVVKKIGRTWSVVDTSKGRPGGTIIEGGFFTREAAQDCLDNLLLNIRDENLAPRRP
jgi:hypothetical protein